MTCEMGTELGRGYTLDPIHLKSQGPFEGTDIEASCLASPRIELRWIEALELMHAPMDETSVADRITNYFITSYSCHLAGVERALTGPIDGLERCGPYMVYHCVRPRCYWQDSERGRTFEGIDECEGKGKPRDFPELNTGQRASIRVLYVFLRLGICRPRVYVTTLCSGTFPP